MAEAVTPYADVFVKAGRPADFIEQLTGSAQALAHSLTGRRSFRGRRSTATATLPADLKRGTAAVKMLDAMVRPYFEETDEELLNGWLDAKKVRKFSVSGGNPGGGAASGGTTPAPALAGGTVAPTPATA